MKTKDHFLLTIMLLIAFQLTGQDITEKTIQWHSPSWFEASAGRSFDEPTTITSTPNSISWKYASDSVKYNLSIISTTGAWSNVANNGSISFGANSGNDSAVIEFRKTSDRTFIRIVVVKQEETLIYELHVTNVEEI